MKQLLVLCVCLIVGTTTYAQNHVLNGDFEQYSNCPNNASQISYANNWNTFTGGTPDYFHVCGTNGFKVPAIAQGYQYPASGSAFAGIYTYTQYYDKKEYIAQTISSLQSGCTYEVSISVVLHNPSKWATDDLGIFFFINNSPILSSDAPLKVIPQVNYYNYGPITDTGNWTRLTALYTPDSAYNHIVIGGFKDSGTVGKAFIWTGTYFVSYYFIDSVVIRPIKVNFIFTDTFLCQNEVINVPYTVLPCANYNIGNIFRLQLSDANGSFANPATIGSVTSTVSGNISGVIPNNTPTGSGYRLRITSTNSIDSSLDNGFNIAIGTPVKATSNSPVCEGEALKVDAINVYPGTTFNWSGPLFSSTQQLNSIVNSKVANSGKYVVTATYKGCEAKDSITVTIKPLPILSPNNNSPICPGETLQLNAGGSYANAIYNWTGPGFSSSDKTPVISSASKANQGIYTVTATVDGCTSIAQNTQVVIKDLPVPPQAIDTTVCRYTTGVKINIQGDSIKWYNTISGAGSFTQPEISTNDTVSTILFATQTVNGCESQKTTFTIKKKDLPIFELGDNITICQGDSVLIGSSQENVTYIWNTGLTTCCIVVKESGTYTQNMTNICGTKTDDITVTASPCGRCVYVPSAFTPNNDGLNDQFGASPICTIKQFRMKIYNRWSDLVFQSGNINDKWDGRVKGKEARMDTYYYYIEYIAETPNEPNRKSSLKGDVTLIR